MSERGCQWHGGAPDGPVPERTRIQVEEIARRQGREVLGYSRSDIGQAQVTVRCAAGHEVVQLAASIVAQGSGCGTCFRTGAWKLHYGLEAFRSGRTAPEKPLALYVYAWDADGYGKAGIGRPVNFWERRHGGRRLHRVEVPALVASVAEEVLLRLLQGEAYRYGVVTEAAHDDGKTERFTLQAYYDHRPEVLSVFEWAQDPASLDYLASILHTPGIEPWFGPNPPTTPPKEPS